MQTRVNAEYMKPLNLDQPKIIGEASGKFADNAAILGSVNINTMP